MKSSKTAQIGVSMSRIPPSKTPGILRRDGAFLDGNSVGTPGPWGINDSAASYANRLGRSSAREMSPVPNTSQSIQWAAFLDALVDWRRVSGPQLAWKSAAHLVITHRAVESSILREMLPTPDVRERLIWVFSGLPQSVVWTDITIDQFSDEERYRKVTKRSGQAAHFMANKGQSQRQAYEWGMNQIFGQVDEAVRALKESDARRGYGDELITPLGHAIHTLQDSFSPVHVQRAKDGDRWLIMRLFVWSEQAPEDHDAGDRTWKMAGEESSENTRLSELGEASFDATMMLLKFYVLCVVNKTSDAGKQERELVKKYLTPANQYQTGW
jgi:hypothetical protein